MGLDQTENAQEKSDCPSSVPQTWQSGKIRGRFFIWVWVNTYTFLVG
jgi:hypothetical protein